MANPTDSSTDCAVLVAESQTLGSIAVIRSLGRAGYRVHAAASVDDALGFHSRYTTSIAKHPPYRNAERFVDWLRSYVQQNDIRVIIPSEGFLIAIRACFQDFAHLVPFGPSAETIYRGLSKYDLFHALLSHPDAGRHLPATRLIHDTQRLTPDHELEGLRLPLFVKADASYSGDGSDSCTRRCESYETARRAVAELAPHYEKLVVQEYVPGVGVGAFFLSWQGAVRAEFMHRRIHEVPHTGGVSSYRKSWFDKNVLEDARLKLNALGWQGVGMFEYRWDASNGEFYLMELNGRFWGSLHLALFAGVDFPALLVACHLGRDSKVVRQWNDVSSRYTFPREIEYVLSVLKDPKVPSSRKLRAVGEFFWLGFDPRVRGDLLYAGDGSLYWRTVMRTARTQLASLREKLAPTKGT